MFYKQFNFLLIADGENGLPSLRVVPKKTSSSQAQEAVSKKQLVLSLDQRRWQVRGFNDVKCFQFTFK